MVPLSTQSRESDSRINSIKVEVCVVTLLGVSMIWFRPNKFMVLRILWLFLSESISWLKSPINVRSQETCVACSIATSTISHYVNRELI